MIKFEFELSNVDAVTLADVLQREIASCHYNSIGLIGKAPVEESEAKIRWYDKRAVYLTQLKKNIFEGTTQL